MGLDLARVAVQLHDMMPRLLQARDEKSQQLERAQRALSGESMDWRALSAALEDRRDLMTFTLPARLVEDPSRVYPSPLCPTDYQTLATDGSQIEVDRHAPLPCYLLSVGKVALRYGSAPQARLASHPALFLPDTAAPPEAAGSEQALEHYDRDHVELQRSVAEARALNELAQGEQSACFTLALLDGSLVLWSAGAGHDSRATDAYVRAYVDALDGLRRLAASRPLALASYVSFPGSAEVVNALRARFCTERDRSYCEARCRGTQDERRPCDVLTALLDRDLFGLSAVKAGERSALFASEPRVMDRYLPAENRVYFFYLNAGPEIGRVEIPAWVALEPELLDLTHATVYDQCRRNFGYPIALMEAHEQAVVSEADRRAFWQMVYRRLAQDELSSVESAKSRSKRTPWV